MQSMAATLASLFGLEAAEEMLAPRKVMVPGITFDDCLEAADKLDVPLDYSKLSVPDLQAIARYYRTKNYNPVPGALQQELVMGEPGRWRTGDWMGREGASVGELMAGALPHGCVLGPRAKLVFVDEARRVLRFELPPAFENDYYERAGLGRWPLE